MLYQSEANLFRGLGITTWELDTVTLEISIKSPKDSSTFPFLSWQDKIHPSDRDYVVNLFLEAINDKRADFDCQCRYQAQDKLYKQIRLRGCTAFVDDSSKVIVLRGIIEDYSDYHFKLSEYKKRIEFLESQARDKSDFFAAVTHELRTPMNGVMGLADLIIDAGKLDRESLDMIQTIKQCGASLLAVVNDTLDLSKMEACKLTLCPANVEIRKLISDIELLFQAKFFQKQHEFLVVISDNVPRWLFADSVRLQQILVNLIGNAQKFTPVGGGMILRVEKISTIGDEVKLRFSVADSGIGIKSEYQQKIFDEYSQETNETAKTFGGTGLGLSIARELVRLFKGNLSVRSEQGKGTVFEFDIQVPVVDTNTNQPQKSELQENLKSLDGMKVLLAEDNLVNQKVASKMLEKSGIVVKIVQNGKEAVEMYQKEKFDIILMDIQMPVMSGDIATQLIREQEKEKGLKPMPIIALTAHAMAGDREKYISLGMNDYVSKPIDKATLINAISQAINNV
jgi:two-component system, sensor histidine kinase